MKQCATCNKTYPESERTHCPDDGTLLMDLASPTEEPITEEIDVKEVASAYNELESKQPQQEKQTNTKNRSSRILRILFILFLSVTLFFASALAWAWVLQYTPVVTLRIHSSTGDTVLWINGKEKGTTPIELQLRPGQYDISLK